MGWFGSVWPNWMFIERSWWQIFLQETTKYLDSFRTILKDISIWVKTAVGTTFWSSFGKIWGSFCSNIWSHCLALKCTKFLEQWKNERAKQSTIQSRILTMQQTFSTFLLVFLNGKKHFQKCFHKLSYGLKRPTHYNNINNNISWPVVVAQLEEWSLPTPEIRGSNPVISKFDLLSTVLKCVENTKIRKKYCFH